MSFPQVRVISHQAVFNTNAYIMLYELESSPFTQKSNNATNNKVKSPLSPETSTSSTSPKTSTNGIGFTSDKVYGPELPPDKAEKKVNGTNPTPLTNGNGNHSESSSSTSDSEPENACNRKNLQKENKPLATPPPSPQKPVFSTNNEAKPPKPPSSPKIQNRVLSSVHNVTSNIPTQISSSNTELIVKQKETSFHPLTTKLVPYETDDSSGSDDSNQSPHELEYRVSTKAAVGEWKVTSTEPSAQSSQTKTWGEKKQDGTVNELFKMSHSGYSAPVASWNGTRAQLDKEISNERREDRKRAFMDNSDQGKTKHQKLCNNSYKSNPGYNPVQEFHNAKNWSQNSGSGHYKPFYSGNRHRRNFHHKGFHKNYRFRQ
ncbi:hypothetical protein Zmor_007147 [Zophobas morio]|uniref:Uncharacterized protein n=1 Tax=Zophobas morio TaxID=2755281 RepID=A0AA38ITA2_9CUCU|nr:hypothetical protein Zmor_007147 [Zophobas morio]